jgi:ABC-2 type transport system ATP-binding protein
VIELTNISKRFGSVDALCDMTLHIGPAELFGFIGPNGAGKSTTMKILAGLLQQDSGVARVCGLDCRTESAKVRMMLGYMPDFLGVYDDLTVDEYLQFFASAFGLPRKARRATIESVLQLTDLVGKQHAPVEGLSRGMQQRLGIARVLLHEPKVLLLDEPASGLDPRARIELRELLVELRRMGKCIMVSSHILSELGEMSTSIGIIERGRLLFAGSIAQAFARSGVGERITVRLEAPADTDAADPAADARRIADTLLREDRVARATGDAESTDGRPPVGRIVIELQPGENGSAHGHHFLIQALIAAGARIGSFVPEQARLEDAFLRLTKGALN